MALPTATGWTTARKSTRTLQFRKKTTDLFSTGSNNEDEKDSSRIDVREDERLYRIRLPRAPGIEWGSDLSFCFVSVRGLDPSGPASLSNQVKVGDLLCELCPVAVVNDNDDISNNNDEEEAIINLIGAPFDMVMNSFANLGRHVQEVDMVFFRGSKEELQLACRSEQQQQQGEDDTIRITVIQNKGGKEEKTTLITAQRGCNIRKELIDRKINVYQSVSRWTNCKGKQLCGTCIVNIGLNGGIENTNRKSVDEESTLRENPNTYRLSCVTFAYGDVTVETFPPIQASQWTR